MTTLPSGGVVARLHALREQLEHAETGVDLLRVERLNLIEEALAQGIRPTVIMRALGISQQRLHQLRHGTEPRAPGRVPR